MTRDVRHQGAGAHAPYVVHAARDDVDEAGLAGVPSSAHRLLGRTERRLDVRVPARLVPEHRQRCVRQREVRVDQGRVPDELLPARLEPHHAFEPRVVHRRGLRGGGQRQAQRVPGPGDRMVPAHHAAVRQSARQRRHRRARRWRERTGCGSPAPPWTPTARRAAAHRAPRRGLRRACGVAQAAPVGVETHAGGGRGRDGDARPPGQQVVEQRVPEEADVRLGPVQLTTQPTARTVPSVSVTSTPPRGSGRASATSAEATSAVPRLEAPG